MARRGKRARPQPLGAFDDDTDMVELLLREVAALRVACRKGGLKIDRVPDADVEAELDRMEDEYNVG